MRTRVAAITEGFFGLLCYLPSTSVNFTRETGGEGVKYKNQWYIELS